jgi:uncharacterized LabA/DUF88 family protein
MVKEHQNGLSVGVYVDVANIALNGGYGMRYEVLREFASRDGAEPTRLNAYVVYDEERGEDDFEYRDRTHSFHYVLRDFGYKVIEKPVRWFTDETGRRYGKANADLDMAVDVLLQSVNLDRVLMVTGDGDFVQVVRALQSRGCRVEVVAFKNVSHDLRTEADAFYSGFLIPNLLPTLTDQARPPWGEVGGRVRGTCYSFNQEKHFGFLRYLKRIAPGLWITDSRREESPYATAFIHESNFPRETPFDILPSRELIFEFDLIASEKGIQATNVSLLHRY